MDFIDILAIVIVVVFIFAAGKFLPNNALSNLGNYIKNLFSSK